LRPPSEAFLFANPFPPPSLTCKRLQVTLSSPPCTLPTLRPLMFLPKPPPSVKPPPAVIFFPPPPLHPFPCTSFDVPQLQCKEKDDNSHLLLLMDSFFDPLPDPLPPRHDPCFECTPPQRRRLLQTPPPFPPETWFFRCLRASLISPPLKKAPPKRLFGLLPWQHPFPTLQDPLWSGGSAGPAQGSLSFFYATCPFGSAMTLLPLSIFLEFF